MRTRVASLFASVVVLAAGCATSQANGGAGGPPPSAATAEGGLTLLDRLGMCSAAAFRAHSQVSSAGGRKEFGKLYTNALYAALAVSSKKEAANAHAVGSGMLILVESQGAEQLERWLTQTFKTCDADVAALRGKLVTPATRQDEAFAAQPEKTMPLDVLAALGKPFLEDYNADGRFVYTYQTKIGMDAYLFDVTGRLIRVRSYCDSLKATCPKATE